MTHVTYSVLVVVFNTPTVVAEGASRQSELRNPANYTFLHRDGINVMTKMSTNELNPCKYTRYFSFANALIVKVFFLKLFSHFLVSFSYFKHCFVLFLFVCF